MAGMDRQSFFKLLSDFPPTVLEEIIVAYWLSKDVHRGQERDGGLRYFEHVRGVAVILIQLGVTDAHTIIKALIHDLMEDTETPFFVVSKLFGESMLESLYVLSKKVPMFDPKTGTVVRWKRIPDDVYYARLAESSESDRLVKCADRLHNLRSMHVWLLSEQVRYALHTQRFVIPIAKNTNYTLFRELEHMVNTVLSSENKSS